MNTTNILERRKKLEQRKNRLKQMEASLKIQERKERTRRLIELGGLVLKAQLQNWSTNTLLGGLLTLKEKETDPSQITLWSHKGGKAFSKGKDKLQEEETKLSYIPHINFFRILI